MSFCSNTAKKMREYITKKHTLCKFSKKKDICVEEKYSYSQFEFLLRLLFLSVNLNSVASKTWIGPSATLLKMLVLSCLRELKTNICSLGKSYKY